MSTLVKSFFVPGSISFLVLGLALAVVLLYGTERTKRWGRAWLTFLVLAYTFLATPLGADLVAGPLIRSFKPILSAEQAKGIDTLVVLSAGTEVYRAYGQEVSEMGKRTSYNALEAARLYRLLGVRTIVATGGIVTPGSQREPEAQILATGLVRLGIPRDRIIVEERSRTTHEQAVNTAEFLRARRVRRFLLVTGADHMPRAHASFRDLGFDPLPSVSVFAIASPPGIWRRLRPSLNALEQSDWACYEYLARIYYWKKGWL